MEIEHLEFRMAEAEDCFPEPKRMVDKYHQGTPLINAARMVHECYINANSRANFFELVDRKIKNIIIRRSISIPKQSFYEPLTGRKKV